MQDCSTCQGTGQRAYGSTSGARGGPGGQVITGDVCDHCWGSGCEDLPGMEMRYVWLELRALRAVVKHVKEHTSICCYNILCAEQDSAIPTIPNSLCKGCSVMWELDRITKGKL